jgi:copper chaperone
MACIHREFRPNVGRSADCEVTAVEEIKVANVKCGGCAATIRKNLTPVAGVKSVDVDIQGGVVKVHGDGLSRSQLEDKLRAIGYPPRG